MENEELLKQYSSHLRMEKHSSENTLLSYLRDLRQFDAFLKESHGPCLINAKQNDIYSFIEFLSEDGKSIATKARFISSIKNFYSYLLVNGFIKENPAKNIKAEKLEVHLPEILSAKEVELLLKQPERIDAKGIRDAAMLELMYATGIRVSELIELNISDINFLSGSLRCISKNKERSIPLYPYAITLLKDYLEYSRPAMASDLENEALFVNTSGNRMSRQGFWKLIKTYQNKANIDKDITPQTLRHSFAAHLLESGADLQSVQKILGHSDIASTMFYTRLIPDPLQERYPHSRNRNHRIKKTQSTA